MKTTNIFVATVISAMIAGAATAQTTTFGLNDAASDEVTDLRDAIDDDARDVTFGNEGRQVGTYGSVALRATSFDSSTDFDVVTIGVGANYGFFDGTNGSEFNLSFVYSDSTDPVAEDTNTVTASYDYTRDFSDRFFGYASIDIKSDQEADPLVLDDISKDAFLGFGVGYRVVNTPSTILAFKAGPGYRGLEKSDGASFVTYREAAYSVEANFSYSFSDTVFLSNDTTVIGSDADTTVKNELAVNVALNNALSLRTSYTSEFNGPDIGSLDNSDNTLGLSVVYNFN